MEDLFEREQRMLYSATSYLDELRNGAVFDIEHYALLVKEYERLLKQLRNFTKLSDRAASNLKLSKQDLLDKIHYDSLTGIYNRRFMEDKLENLTSAFQVHGGWLSVLMLDIDYFKRYNDTYGHQMGDECLRIVAKSLDNAIKRKGDFVARYGGEEFIVVLPNTDEVGACKIADSLLRNVRECRILHAKNDAMKYVTISIGVTAGYVAHMQMVKDLIKRADQALYNSKESGRNRYTFMKLERGIL